MKSKAQRRFMWAKHPRIARRWEDHTPAGAKLPEKVSKLKALPHQDRAVDKLEDSDTGSQLTYHGIGSGKTFTSIHAANRHKLPVLAIVPAALRNNYRKELDASGTGVKGHVMSYQEAVNRLKDQDFLNEAQRSLVVMDEAHRLGQQESQRSQLASLPAKKKMLLTATPIRNHPSELGPLVNAINPGSVPGDAASFNKQFIESREIPVGFFGRLMGAKPGIERRAKNLHQLHEAVRGNVDHFENLDRRDYPSFSETIHEVPMTHKQQAAYDYMLGKYPALAYKVKHGIPPGLNEERDMGAFFSGPRQVSNHPGAFNASATDDDAPKFHKAADELEKKFKADPNFRGVVYSSFLDAGIEPMSRILKKRGVPHATFTGGLSDKERKKLVEDYNAGRNPVLLLSGAGAEGLDLKGTKLMQLMEPHWNEELMDQVRGRGIRYKSHSHLPEDERHVEVQRFHAVPQRSFIGRLTAKSPHGRGVDQYLYEVAKRKRELNQPFLDVLKEEGQKEASILHVEFINEEPMAQGDDDWKNHVPTFETKEAGLLRPAASGKSLMSRLYPGDPSARYDYSQELANHASQLSARTGVPHDRAGNIDFDSPLVQPAMNLVSSGALQVPQEFVANEDSYGLWRWAARETQKLKMKKLLPTVGFPSAPAAPSVSGSSIVSSAV